MRVELFDDEANLVPPVLLLRIRLRLRPELQSGPKLLPTVLAYPSPMPDVSRLEKVALIKIVTRDLPHVEHVAARLQRVPILDAQALYQLIVREFHQTLEARPQHDDARRSGPGHSCPPLRQ